MQGIFGLSSYCLGSIWSPGTFIETQLQSSGGRGVSSCVEAQGSHLLMGVVREGCSEQWVGVDRAEKRGRNI